MGLTPEHLVSTFVFSFLCYKHFSGLAFSLIIFKGCIKPHPLTSSLSFFC